MAFTNEIEDLDDKRTMRSDPADIDGAASVAEDEAVQAEVVELAIETKEPVKNEG